MTIGYLESDFPHCSLSQLMDWREVTIHSFGIQQEGHIWFEMSEIFVPESEVIIVLIAPQA